MTSLMNTKLTDRSVIAASAFGISLRGTGLSVLSALLPVMPVSERDERPTQAPAVAAAAAQAQAYAFAAAAYGSRRWYRQGRDSRQWSREWTAEDAARHEVGLPRARTLE